MRPTDGCLCTSGSPENYEGPACECPQHGTVLELAEVEYLTIDPAHPHEVLFDADELPSYRLGMSSKTGWNYIELRLDAAEYALVRHIVNVFEANANKSKPPLPTLCFDRRIKQGPLAFDSNFTDA